MTFVSIIVNCYNQGCYLEKSVKSVLEQTFTDLECLIVDDGSQDNTREVAEELIKLDSRVKYYYKENAGLPAARNFGIQQSKGEWIQCLDADDWIHPDKTRFQLEHLNGSEDQDLFFYCNYERIIFDQNDQIIESQPNIVGQLNREDFIQRLLIADFLVESAHPALQQAMLMKRSIFEKYQFPEEMKALGDRYFAIDILKGGVQPVYTPIVGAFYTKHQKNRTNSWDYMKNYYLKFYEKIQTEHLDLIKSPLITLELLLNEAIRDQNQEDFNRLITLIPFPAEIKLDLFTLTITQPSMLKLLYKLRTLIPSFILYEKYRGQRSKRLISLLKLIFPER